MYKGKPPSDNPKYFHPYRDPKVVVIQQNTYSPTHLEIQELAKQTWQTYAESLPNLQILNYYGGIVNGKKVDKRVKKGKPVLLDKNTLTTGLEDIVDLSKYSDGFADVDREIYPIVDTRFERMLITMEYCLENYEFDYIYRSGGTSYPILSKLYQLISRLPRKGIYNGRRSLILDTFMRPWVYDSKGRVVYNAGYYWYYVTGHDVIFSRDIVQSLVKHKGKLLKHPLRSTLLEDVYMGYAITRILKLIDPIGIDQLCFQSTIDLRDDKSLVYDIKTYMKLIFSNTGYDVIHRQDTHYCFKPILPVAPKAFKLLHEEYLKYV